MKTSNKRSLIYSVPFLAAAFAVTPAAYAQDNVFSIAVPTQTMQDGSVFVMETIVYNVRTGQRATVSMECVVGDDQEPTLDCMQVNTTGTSGGMTLNVKTGASGGPR